MMRLFEKSADRGRKASSGTPSRRRRAGAGDGPYRHTGADGGLHRRASGLLASAVALALALGMLVGVGAAGAATDPGPVETSTGGSTVGILIDNTPTKEDIESGKFTGNDSYLGILLGTEESEDVVVEFMLTADRSYARVSVPAGTPVARPNDPVWPAGEAPPPGMAGTPVFDRWCIDAACTMAYDFSTPVVADPATGRLTLWAGWAAGDPVDVRLHAGDGGTVPDPDDPTASPQQDLTVQRYPGALYRTLPAAQRTGYTFQCWETSDGTAVDPASDRVPADGIDLYARWAPNTYWVHYAFNDGTGGYKDVQMTYDDADGAALSWGAASGDAPEPYGKDFDGWNTKKDGSGTWYAAGAPLVNLTAAANGWVSLYAQWKDEFTVEEGPFEVRFMTNDGTGDAWRAFVGDDRIAKGERIAAFDPPKRAGYQFSAWWVGHSDAADPSGAPVLERAWSFDEQVMEDLTLYAVWTLRMDVTVPVSVGFAVDAESRAVATPDAGRYALKSRTVVPVQVEEMAVVSPQDELDGFFQLPEGATGEDAWADALNKTELWVWKADGSLAQPDTTVRPAGAGSVALPLANASGDKGAYVKRADDGTETTIYGWRNAQSLRNDAAFRLDAFAYGGTPVDEQWQGADPASALPLKFGMSIPDKLEVRTDGDGPRSITHLVVTVSAKG